MNDQNLSSTVLNSLENGTYIDAKSFEKYQRFTEQTIADLSNKITELETQLNVFTNLLEISQYINQYIKSQDLFPLINDMLIGVFGAKYSTIYIKSNDTYVPVTPRHFSSSAIAEERALIYKHHETSFVLNSDTPIYAVSEDSTAIHSCLGVPITMNAKTLGFVIIQHQQCHFFTQQHATFLSSLANHIGVAIENNILYNQIKECASKDGLTNIFNKKYFFDTLHAIPSLEQDDYSIVMIDIDNFKKVNDTYGHPYGDEVLKKVCSIIKNHTRPQDIVARYGGEEIIIYFHHFTNTNLLEQRLETIRSAIENCIIPGEGFFSSVTASFGCYIKHNEYLPLETVIQFADDNLYTCKRNGKNRVLVNH